MTIHFPELIVSCQLTTSIIWGATDKSHTHADWQFGIFNWPKIICNVRGFGSTRTSNRRTCELITETQKTWSRYAEPDIASCLLKKNIYIYGCTDTNLSIGPDTVCLHIFFFKPLTLFSSRHWGTVASIFLTGYIWALHSSSSLIYVLLFHSAPNFSTCTWSEV